ncbi:MAG: diguanylate cyclase [Veillonellales bacterium]
MFKNLSKFYVLYALFSLIFTGFLFIAVPPGIFNAATILFPAFLLLALRFRRKNTAYGFAAAALISHHWLLNAIAAYKSIGADAFTPFIINAGFLYAPVLPNPFFSILAVTTLTFHFINYDGGISALIVVKIICTILFALLASMVVRFFRNLSVERNRFYQASITDPLTGLSTFTHAIHLGQKMLSAGKQVIVALIDFDNFKSINDTYGHVIGNKVLIQFAAALRKLVISESAIARLGGDEFVLILGQESGDALAVAAMLEQLETTCYVTDNDLNPIQIAFSYGIALQSKTEKMNIEELINLADKNMYCNKTLKNMHPTLHDNVNNIPENFQEILTVLEQKDIYSYVHSQAVAHYSAFLAEKAGMDASFVDRLYLAGWLHDIGKIAVSNHILRKPGKLSEKEYHLMQNHVEFGMSFLKLFAIDDTVGKAIENHHERYDGYGYPHGRMKNGIPFEGRILAIADAYAAMTVKRVYRKIMAPAEALQELKNEKESQFDPQLVDIFVANMLKSHPVPNDRVTLE